MPNQTETRRTLITANTETDPPEIHIHSHEPATRIILLALWVDPDTYEPLTDPKERERKHEEELRKAGYR